MQSGGHSNFAVLDEIRIKGSALKIMSYSSHPYDPLYRAKLSECVYLSAYLIRSK
jgi:hypothetical protein